MSILARVLCCSCICLAVHAAQLWPTNILTHLQRQAIDAIDSAHKWPLDVLRTQGTAPTVVTSPEVEQIMRSLAYEPDFTAWVLRDCSEEFAGQRLDELQKNSVTSMLAAISGNGDQKTVKLCVAYIDSFVKQISACKMPSDDNLVERANTLKSQLQLAQHHKWMVTNGQDPFGIYAVNASSTLVPPKPQGQPNSVAEWFLAKVASLDFLSHKAIEEKAGLDDAYLLTHRCGNSIVRVGKGLNITGYEAEHTLAVLQRLEAHVDLLGALLRASGAHVVYVDPLDLAVTYEDQAKLPLQEYNDNLTYSVIFRPFVITDCAETRAEAGVSDLERVSLTALLSGVSALNNETNINKALARTADFRRMIRACVTLTAKNCTFLPRINEVEAELRNAAHHRWMVANGQDPIGLYSRFSDPSDLVPKVNSNLSVQIGWLLGKVTGLDFLVHQSATSEQGLGEAYNSSVQVQVAMQQFLDSLGMVNKSSPPLTQRAKAVVETLQGHVERLQLLLLFAEGALPTIEPEQLPQPELVDLQQEADYESLADDNRDTPAEEPPPVEAANEYADSHESLDYQYEGDASPDYSYDGTEADYESLAYDYRAYDYRDTPVHGPRPVEADHESLAYDHRDTPVEEPQRVEVGYVAPIDEGDHTPVEKLSPAEMVEPMVDVVESNLSAPESSPHLVELEGSSSDAVKEAFTPNALELVYTARLKYNTTYSKCALATCSKAEVETRLDELEAKSLTALMSLVSRIGDPRTFTAARNATSDMRIHIDECNINSWRSFSDRTNFLQSEFEAAAHHRWMVANARDPLGLYRLDTTFTPEIDKTPLEKADWFVAKVTSVDLLTHKALDGWGDVNEAYRLNGQLAVSMSVAIERMGLKKTLALNTDMKAVHAATVLNALIDHTKTLQELLRQRGASV